VLHVRVFASCKRIAHLSYCINYYQIVLMKNRNIGCTNVGLPSCCSALMGNLGLGRSLYLSMMSSNRKQFFSVLVT